MRFVSKRGRPKKIREQHDRGTAEFQRRQQAGQAVDPLSWCLKNRLISKDQYDIGGRLRWLYTTQYGSMSPRSVEWGDRKGGFEREDGWLLRRKRELDGCADALKHATSKRCVYSVCVFQEWPMWLVKAFYDSEDNPEMKYFRLGLTQLLVSMES